MRMKNILLSGITLSIIFISIKSFAQTANPTRPSASDNAYLTEYGYSELEIGYSGDNNVDAVPTLLKFSVLKKLEVGLFTSGFVYYDGNEIEFGDPGFQLKYQVINNNDLAASIVGKMGFSSSSSPSYSIYAVPTFQTGFAQFDLTLGTSYIKNTSEYDYLYFYALAFTPKLDLPIGIYSEIFGETINSINSLYVDFGVSYPVHPDFVLDTAITLGLNENSADWVFQIGLTKTLFKFL